MTGHFPARYNIDGHFAWVPQNEKRNMPDWLSPDAPLLPRLLKRAGYATAHFGKWHLSNDMIPDSPLPSAYGYDEYGAFNCAGEQMPVHEDAQHAIAFKAIPVVPDTRVVWQPSCQQRSSRGATHSLLRVCPVKAPGTERELVNVWRLCERVAVAPECGPEIVNCDEQNVQPLRRWFRQVLRQQRPDARRKGQDSHHNTEHRSTSTQRDRFS